MPPHPLLVTALAVMLIPLAAVLIGRRPSAARTALTVLTAQLAFHVVFHALGGTLTATTATAGHSHHTIDLGPVVSTAIPDVPMLLAHVCAAVLTAVLLWNGERMVRGIAAWARARLLPPTPMLLGRYELPLVPASPALTVRLSPLAATVSRRGPPVL